MSLLAIVVVFLRWRRQQRQWFVMMGWCGPMSAESHPSALLSLPVEVVAHVSVPFLLLSSCFPVVGMFFFVWKM